MPLSEFKIETVEKKEFPPVPEDIYQVQLLDVTEKFVDSKFKPGTKERLLSFQFTILDQGEYRGRNIWRNNVPSQLWESSKGKNLLFKITEAIIMRPFTEQEALNMTSTFINKLIGFQCRIVVKNTVGADKKVWNNIDSFLPKKVSLPSLTDEEKKAATVKPKETTVEQKEEVEVVYPTEDELSGVSPIGQTVPEIDVKMDEPSAGDGGHLDRDDGVGKEVPQPGF